MPVELPSTADVRRMRQQAAKTAAERAAAARTPLLAVLGAGDLAVTAVAKVVADARTRATAARTRAGAQAEDVQHRVTGLPQHLNADELRKTAAEFRAQAEQAYASFAEHGETTWGRIREQPQVKDALARIDAYTEKLDSRVDDFVDDARDAAEKALAAVTTQTRSSGERVARATQRFSGRAAETVTEAGKDVSTSVAEAGADAADAISTAGNGVARETRSASRKVADRTAPKPAAAAAPKVARKPAPRSTGSNNSKPRS